MNATDASLDTHHPLHERVELIVHLLKFSDRLFAIMSPAADELRTFADLLIKAGGTGLLFARVHPELALSAEDVAADLARAWAIELDLGESAMQAIEQRLPEQLLEPRRAVAIIEDVERLPAQALDELIGFMQRLDERMGGRARLVLLGGPHLAGQLQHMQSLESGGQIYALHLAPPPAETFADMVSGAAGDTSPVFDRPTPRPNEGTGLPTRALLIGGIATSLTLAVAIALLLRPSEPDVAKDQQVSIPLKHETATTAPATPPVTAMREPAMPPPIGHQLTDPPPAALPVPAVPPPQPVTTVEPKPSVPPPTVEPAATMPLMEAKPSIASPPPNAEPKPNPSAPKSVAKPAKKEATPWYAQQKGDQYVLQIISLSSEAEVERFIQRNGLKDCHSFRQVRSGQTLHTLTCGLYPNRDAASQAAAKLPEKARVAHPFPRRIDDIRKIMQP